VLGTKKSSHEKLAEALLEKARMNTTSRGKWERTVLTPKEQSLKMHSGYLWKAQSTNGSFSQLRPFMILLA